MPSARPPGGEPAAATEPATAEMERLRRERDLYRRLLDLGAQAEIEPFLEEVLALMVEATGARRGYVELLDESVAGDPLRFSVARGCSSEEVAHIQAAISRGVIAEALATGETIVSCASEDPRFRDRGSVRKHRISAVLCAPIGDPALGVLYLQDREQPGPFSEEDRLRAETFAAHIAALADRLLIRRRYSAEADPTLPFRKKLRAEGLIGRSRALAEVLKHASLAAPLDVGVLLTGPSGTGKSHVARVIHESGPRAEAPFIELNCATLPEGLVESELFGAVPGAHSTATRRVEGKVAAAERGTLFLDEIGELHGAAQAKLLQLLQNKEYFPLGGARRVSADVRIIAATNADLKDLVAQRKFREDLYYRLQVLPIRLPSLAERRDDLPELSAYFCARAVEAHRLRGIELSPGAIRAIAAADWPGNLRELAHTIEAAVIRAAGEGVLEVERVHVFPDPRTSLDGPQRISFQAATRRFQEQLLRSTLEETGWNVAETASRLDLARSHIYNLIRAHGIERARG